MLIGNITKIGYSEKDNHPISLFRNVSRNFPEKELRGIFRNFSLINGDVKWVSGKDEEEILKNAQEEVSEFVSIHFGEEFLDSFYFGIHFVNIDSGKFWGLGGIGRCYNLKTLVVI